MAIEIPTTNQKNDLSLIQAFFSVFIFQIFNVINDSTY
jgi:hypothetical protein